MLGSGMILVTGATGNVGGGVIASLIAMGANVRALVRDDVSFEGATRQLEAPSEAAE